MHFLFLAAQFEFMTWFPTMILYFIVCTGFTAGSNIKWDVLHALRFCTGRYPHGHNLANMAVVKTTRRKSPLFVDRMDLL